MLPNYFKIEYYEIIDYFLKYVKSPDILFKEYAFLTFFFIL